MRIHFTFSDLFSKDFYTDSDDFGVSEANSLFKAFSENAWAGIEIIGAHKYAIFHHDIDDFRNGLCHVIVYTVENFDPSIKGACPGDDYTEYKVAMHTTTEEHYRHFIELGALLDYEPNPYYGEPEPTPSARTLYTRLVYLEIDD